VNLLFWQMTASLACGLSGIGFPFGKQFGNFRYITPAYPVFGFSICSEVDNENRGRVSLPKVKKLGRFFQHKSYEGDM
jgi:hypothetical protein